MEYILQVIDLILMCQILSSSKVGDKFHLYQIQIGSKEYYKIIEKIVVFQLIYGTTIFYQIISLPDVEYEKTLIVPLTKKQIF